MRLPPVTRRLLYPFLLSGLLLLCHDVRADTPFSFFASEARKCRDAELVARISKWLYYQDKYFQAVLWLRQCATHPEAAPGLRRKVSQDVFRFENPPDVAKYLEVMKESALKRRVALTWRVYRILVEDKRSYMPAERRELAAIPTLLEDVILNKTPEVEEYMCRTESYIAHVRRNTIRETEFWRNFQALQSRGDLGEEDRRLLARISGCVRGIYKDSSIGRRAFLEIMSEAPAPAWQTPVTRRLERYLAECSRHQKIYELPDLQESDMPVMIPPGLETFAPPEHCDIPLRLQLLEDGEARLMSAP